MGSAAPATHITMSDSNLIPTLRYRRFGGGYRRAEVLYHLRELEAIVRRLELGLAAAQGRSQELTESLAAAAVQAQALTGRADAAERELEAERRRADDRVEAAEHRARAILAEADEQAARIRGGAYLKVDEIGRQLEEILRLRSTMTVSLRGILEDVGVALARIERGELLAAPGQAAATPTAERTAAAPSSPPFAPADEQLFERKLEIDVGPFADFASLSEFERALAALPRVDDVYVRRFQGERATIELAMAHEQPLLALLRGTLPYGFEAERVEPGALRLTLESPSLASAG